MTFSHTSVAEDKEARFLEACAALVRSETHMHNGVRTWSARAMLVFRLDRNPARAWAASSESVIEGAYGNGAGNIPEYFLSDDLDPDGLVRAMHTAWRSWQDELANPTPQHTTHVRRVA